jgi:hypothetical protein
MVGLMEHGFNGLDTDFYLLLKNIHLIRTVRRCGPIHSIRVLIICNLIYYPIPDSNIQKRKWNTDTDHLRC